MTFESFLSNDNAIFGFGFAIMVICISLLLLILESNDDESTKKILIPILFYLGGASAIVCLIGGFGVMVNFLIGIFAANCNLSGWTWTQCDHSEVMQRTRTILRKPGFFGEACGALSETRSCSIDCDVAPWREWSACAEDEVARRVRAVNRHATRSGKPCGALSETRSCSIDCDVAPWREWSACRDLSGMKLRARTIRSSPSKSGKECPALEDQAPCAVDCTLAHWMPWNSCSTSCDGGHSVRSRAVITHPKNGGKSCGPTEDSVECSGIPCYVLQLKSAMSRDCEITSASELDKVLLLLVANGVEKSSDICLLSRANLHSPSIVDLRSDNRAMKLLLADKAHDHSTTAMLVVTEQKLQRCICNVLCKVAGSPICEEAATTTKIRKEEGELAGWIEEACGISNGLKEIVDALQAMGVETKHDLRYMTEAMADGLTGIPIIRREKLRECLRRRVQEDL
jgi:hypothetical protein